MHFVIKKYIEIDGEDEFMENYRPFLNEETGTVLTPHLITDEFADAILDYIRQLSCRADDASFALPNTLISDEVAGRHIRRIEKEA